MNELVIDQLVPVLHRRDAVGEHTLKLRELLRDRGVNSEIYVEIDDPETSKETLPLSFLPQSLDIDLVVYQMSTGSKISALLQERDDNLVVNYHNVTPAEYFAPWDNALALHQVIARHECGLLSSRASLAVAVSEFNRVELEELGYERTVVIPPSSAVGRSASADQSARLTRRYPGGDLKATRWLSVGRLAPNKAIEDTMTALLAFRIRHDPDATLTVIGKPAVASYTRALKEYSVTLGLSDAVSFEGSVSASKLDEAYRLSEVFVSTSEHEGFCLPLVEAMANDLPIVGCKNAAIPEVLGDAGTLVDGNDPVVIADAVARILRDDALWRRHVDAGEKRLADLDLESAGARLVDLLIQTAQVERARH